MQYIGKLTREGKNWLVEFPDCPGCFLRQSGLDALSSLYADPRTALHRRILGAVRLFSRVSLATELTDKLVLLFASLESLFLKSATEPIQQNLGDRLAWMVGKDPTERRDIVATTKQVYQLRSRFVHHAQEIDDMRVIERFMLYAWRGLHGMLQNRDTCADLEKLLTKIDDKKYG